jgi:hypothetical protein
VLDATTSSTFPWGGLGIITLLAVATSYVAYLLWFDRVPPDLYGPSKSPPRRALVSLSGSGMVAISVMFLSLDLSLLFAYARNVLDDNSMWHTVFSVLLTAGLVAFGLGALAMFSIFFFSKPRWLIPPSLRKR